MKKRKRMEKKILYKLFILWVTRFFISHDYPFTLSTLEQKKKNEQKFRYTRNKFAEGN